MAEYNLKIKIQGRMFDFPQLDSMTFREAKLVKKVSNLRLGEFAEALEAGDVDMLLAMAAVAKLREDGAIDEDALLDLPIDQIEVLEEVVPDPPAGKAQAKKKAEAKDEGSEPEGEKDGES